MKGEKRPAAVFLDRDGTINEEVGYLDRMEKLQLIPGAAEAIRLINKSGMKAVVVTNQSGVARGVFDEVLVEKTHDYLRDILRADGALIDAFYFCPHHPTEGRVEYLKICDCRKPSPGMLLRAVEELRIDPNRSYMVGDTLKDIEAGARAGVQGILVRTGYGEEAAAQLGPDEESQKNGDMMPHRAPIEKAGPEREVGIVRPVYVAGDLLAAVKWILRNRKS
ncbi:MAG: HAD family hydrolase [Deltaproteobacteria bacterium]|nr:HAD family hydrolase [Deltaproteobacteria bacterium]